MQEAEGEGEGEGEGEDCVETTSGYHFTADAMKCQQEKKKRRKNSPEKDGKWPGGCSEGLCTRLPGDRGASSGGDVFCEVVSGSELSTATRNCRGAEGDGPALQQSRWDRYTIGGGCTDVLASPEPLVPQPLPVATGERKFSCPVLQIGREDMRGGWEGSLGKIGWKSGSYKVADM